MSDIIQKVTTELSIEVRNKDLVDKVKRSLRGVVDELTGIDKAASSSTFETKIKKAASAVDQLSGKMSAVEAKISKFKPFADKVDFSKAFSPDVAAALDKYSRGYRTVRADQREFLNGELNGRRLSLAAWRDASKQLDDHITKMHEAHDANRDLNKTEIEGLHKAIATAQEYARIHERGRDRLLSYEDDYASKLRTKTTLEERHAKVVADAHAQQMISGEALADFEQAQIRRTLQGRMRLNTLKTKHLEANTKAEKAAIQEQIDAEEHKLAQQTAALENNTRFRISTGRRLNRWLSSDDASRLKEQKAAQADFDSYLADLAAKGRVRLNAKAAAERQAGTERKAAFQWEIKTGKALNSEKEANESEEVRRRRGILRELTRAANEQVAETKKQAKEKAAFDASMLFKDERLRKSYVKESLRAWKEDQAEKKKAHGDERRRILDIGKARKEAMGYGKRAASAPMQMMNRADGHGFFTSPAFYAMAGFGAITQLVRKAISAAVSTDTAEERARIHMDMSDSEAVRARKFSTRVGVSMGVAPQDMLNATVDAAQSGVPDKMAPEFAQMATKLAKIYEMSVPQTVDDMGYAISGEIGTGRIKEGGPEGLDAVRRIGNVSGYLASKLAFRPDAMMSFMRTGMGNGATLGLDNKNTLALGAILMNAGAQGQQAARGVGHIAEQVHELPLKEQAIRDARSHGARLTPEQKLFLEAPKLLGYGTWKNFQTKMKKDPNEVFNLIEKFDPAKNPKLKDDFKRDQVITAIFGADFKRFITNAARASGNNKRALGYAKEADEQKEGEDFLSHGWAEHIKSYQYLIEVMTSSWKAISDQFGRAFKPFAAEVSQFFNKFQKRVSKEDWNKPIKALVDGLLQGFGFQNLTQVLDQFMPGRGRFNIQKWQDFGEGFSTGVRRIWEVVKGIGSGIANVLARFGIKASTPKAIGELIGELLAFSLAVHFARPAFAILGFAKDGLIGLAAGIMAIRAALTAARLGKGAAAAGALAEGAGVAGAAGMAGAGAAGAAGASRLGQFGRYMGLKGGIGAIASRFSLLFLVAEIAQYTPQISNLMITAIKKMFKAMYDGIVEGVTEFSKNGFWEGVKSAIIEAIKPAWIDKTEEERKRRKPEDYQPPVNKDLQHQDWWELKKDMSYEGGGGFDRRLIHGASYGGDMYGRRSRGGGAGVHQRMLHNAAFNPNDDIARNTRQLVNNTQMGARLQLAAFGQGAVAAITHGSGGGAALGQGGPRTASDGWVGPRLRVPDGMFGGRRGGGGGGGGGANGMPDPGAGTGPYKGLLDHIARSEGTAGGVGGGYNVSLANGKLLPGGQEQDLKNMTLDQIDALQTGMLHHPGNKWNSSALGRYQIVQKTLRGLRSQLGLKGSDKFDENMQDRLGATLAKQRGANGSLGKEWASLRGDKLSTAISLAQGIPGSASTTPSGRPEPAGGGGDGSVGERIAELRKSGAISGTECVDLVKAYTGTKNMTTRQWGRGANAAEGGLQPGDAVATFLDGRGRLSSQYAGGTGGTAGAGRDHAAIFDSYIKNEAGKIIGMNVTEQYNKTKGEQVKGRYMFGQGSGEKDGANYFKVLGPDGQPLGGARAARSANAVAAAIGGKAADAVDIAKTFEGMDEDKDRASLSKFTKHDVKGDVNAWCARFVNSSLEAAGVKSTGSPLASSYLKWGKEVDNKSELKKGDVLVEDHRDDKSTPFKAGMGGGHVNLATGKTKFEDGKYLAEVISGNHENAVKSDWVEVNKMAAIRRQADASALANAAVGVRRPDAGTLADQVPTRPAAGGGTGDRADAGGGTTIHAPVTINGANQSPAELAGSLQRHVQQARSWRAHDMEPELT